ncbi:hypothetical protein AB0K88_24315 [Streptomyces werraensis]|uniref:hypothetical protein n=1 Tax=Streptomyces werraensis TaxID=68284 RepID=UPI0034384F44
MDLQREIDRLHERLRWQRDDTAMDHTAELELRQLLNNIIDQAEPLSDIDPNVREMSPEDIERLRIAAKNMLLLAGPHIRRRQAARRPTS